MLLCHVLGSSRSRKATLPEGHATKGKFTNVQPLIKARSPSQTIVVAIMGHIYNRLTHSYVFARSIPGIGFINAIIDALVATANQVKAPNFTSYESLYR